MPTVPHLSVRTCTSPRSLPPAGLCVHPTPYSRIGSGPEVKSRGDCWPHFRVLPLSSDFSPSSSGCFYWSASSSLSLVVFHFCGVLIYFEVFQFLPTWSNGCTFLLVLAPVLLILCCLLKGCSDPWQSPACLLASWELGMEEVAKRHRHMLQ